MSLRLANYSNMDGYDEYNARLAMKAIQLWPQRPEIRLLYLDVAALYDRMYRGDVVDFQTFRDRARNTSRMDS